MITNMRKLTTFVTSGTAVLLASAGVALAATSHATVAPHSATPVVSNTSTTNCATTLDCPVSLKGVKLPRNTGTSTYSSNAHGTKFSLTFHYRPAGAKFTKSVFELIPGSTRDETISWNMKLPVSNFSMQSMTVLVPGRVETGWTRESKNVWVDFGETVFDGNQRNSELGYYVHIKGGFVQMFQSVSGYHRIPVNTTLLKIAENITGTASR